MPKTTDHEQSSPPVAARNTSLEEPARLPRRRAVLFAAAGVVLAGVVATLLFTLGGSPSNDVAPAINQASASVLSLDVLNAQSTFRAPDFTLTDQAGRPMSLSAFRGDSVVLSFNDDQCPDLCTLLAQAVVVAQGDLGRRSRVVFLSVNVNPFFPAVKYVKSWTDDHGLASVPNWYFGTASVPALQRIWHAYGVEVQTDPATQTVVHGTQLFFIGPEGRVRAFGDFGLDAADTQYFAHAMAQMAVDLLPAGEQHPVGGPGTPPAARGNISPGSPAPTFDLPQLASGGHVRLADVRGRPTVLTFWSPVCAPCLAELSALEKAHQDLGDKVNFVAVDVAGDTKVALAIARRQGVTFPLAADPSGTVASSYEISGTPYSFIVSPSGAIKVVHPATFTTEQVEYVLKSFYPSLDSAS